MNNKLGKIGEDTATKYLEKMKYKILKRNYRSRKGEIDIIAKYGNILVIIEVKSRNNKNYGYPIEAVNKIKADKIKFSSITFKLIPTEKLSILTAKPNNRISLKFIIGFISSSLKVS